MLKTALIKPFLLVISISCLALLVQLLEPDSVALFRYQRDSVLQGEWWRILTANFTHSSWNHLLLNLAGLLLIDYFYQPVITQIHRACLLLFCMLFNVVLLHVILKLEWYVGLSGALHGYLVGGALLSFKRDKLINALILIVVTGKLFAELNWDINQVTAEFIKSNVVEEAHLYGAISAIIYFAIITSYRLFLKREKGA
ncbi:rhombosortase [Aliikangiella coralliicola]|uniref:Rhombosortase n=1 Tax=Aliikangiella coralliicola TaxID=2592383 RepID=A0A545U4V4_9GAMM|nr:rhombosortase [Aliikangiella coralliicola]TQV84499.1 rhombosortase [Aliikangiella coralliicola]